MIRQLGSHRGKQIIFGYDRYLVPELDAYVQVFSKYGIPAAAVVPDALHYLSSAERVCARVRGRTDVTGILVCSTGIGMSIAANKTRGIYAARCLSVEDAELARTINNANVLCLAARSGLELNEAIVDAYMVTPYEGRKLEQLENISLLEIESHFPPAAAIGRGKPKSAKTA